MLIFLTAVAAQLQPVSINEIAWMGDSNNWRNEWIEIKNSASQAVDLTNWTLLIDEKRIGLLGKIKSDGFFLIAKDKNISPNLLFKGSLNNNGNHLTLLDSSNRIVDELNFSSGWPGGDNETKRTLEKSASSDWQTSLNVGGTPGKENSKLAVDIKKLSDIKIDKLKDNYINNFDRIFLRGLLTAFFITIISLYLNLKIKKYSINN